MSTSSTMTVRIAGISVALDLAQCDPATRERVAERYAAFRVSPQPEAFAIGVRVEPGLPFIPLDNTSIFQLRTALRGQRIEIESHYIRGWVDCTAGQGELIMRPGSDPENFLRVLYAWLCLEHGGLLLHASGVIRHGRAYVFCGPSGNGKTTIARLSLEHVILSDDLVIVKKEENGVRAYGVPFRGDFAQAPRTNASADLCGFFALFKDTEHRVEPLAVPEAIARLSACVPFVMAQNTNAQRVLQVCMDLAARVPVRALHFRRDSGFWEAIDGIE